MANTLTLLIVIELGALVGVLLGSTWGGEAFLSGAIGAAIGGVAAIVGVLLTDRLRRGSERG
jgi:hypothetical protein